MKENILIKKLDAETKNRLVSILNSKTLDSDEIRDEFEAEITNYVDDNDLEDLGIYSEDLDYDYLIIYFMQFLPKRKLRESTTHRRRLNGSPNKIKALFRNSIDLEP